MRSEIMQEVREFADGLTRTRDFAIKVIKAAGLDDLVGRKNEPLANYAVFNFSSDEEEGFHSTVLFDSDFSPQPFDHVTLDYDTGYIHLNHNGLYMFHLYVEVLTQEDVWIRGGIIGDFKVKKSFGHFEDGLYADNLYTFLAMYDVHQNSQPENRQIAITFLVYGYPIIVRNVMIRIWKVL